jgi:hypothetical protein
MEIFLPKTDTGGNEKSSDYWEAKTHESSATQKEQIISFGEYFSKLSKKTKEINEELSIAKETIKLADENAKKTLRISEDTRALVIFGFLVLLLMVAGMILAYWQFIYLDGKETNKEIIENKIKMIEIESQSEIFKNCLKSGGWSKCFN